MSALNETRLVKGCPSRKINLGGKRLDLAKQIDKGGEGKIYLLDNDPKRAVKFYYTDSQNKGNHHEFAGWR